MKPKPEPRRRNAAATRQAILDSAREAFARAGYDGVGVREIASGAGVTAMLVNRYFGSKEELFAEAIAASMAQPIILAAARLASGPKARDMAAALVQITQPGATPLEGFRIMLHSAASKSAAKIGRREISKHHLRTMTDALHGAHAGERAAILLALVAGVQVMRQMIALPALADAEPKALARLLTPLFQQLIDG
jgi:AcrR family transcriptional regulator